MEVNVKNTNNIISKVYNNSIAEELGIEVVNDAKVKIAVEDSEEPWDDLDTTDENVDKKIDEEVKEDFI